MSILRPQPGIIAGPRTPLRLVRAAVLGSAGMMAIGLLAQSDNFDSGMDSGWSKVSNPNYPATYSFPPDAFGGHAYRLQAGAPPEPWSEANTARAVAYRGDRLYTNFFVAADIVAWDAGHTNNAVFGVLARATPATIASGVFDAAMFVVEVNRFSDAAGSRGRIIAMSLSVGQGGGPAALAECTLVRGRQYRLTFSGTNNVLTGAIYDVEDLTRPLLSLTGDDGIANSGFFGGPFPDPSAGGYSGLISFSSIGTGTTTIFAGGGTDPTADTTFDNFVAAEFPPTTVVAPGTPHGLAAAPQVVNRMPVSFANFYPAASGITFQATTLTTTNAINTAAIKLYLNGVDVSSGLNITGFATNAAVAYHGLDSNLVYQARIELQDVLGRKTTNAWTFDTFSDAYLASSHAKNIECEDYDFNNGDFIDNPPPSGYATNDYPSEANPFNVIPTGYLDAFGNNAKTIVGGLDFFDWDANPQTDANFGNENDFRHANSVGTQLGTITHLSSDTNDPLVIVINRSFDTQRQKYYQVHPALHDYVVERTEGGEWLNYTRIFPNAAYYNVYLRYNSGLAQTLALDRIGSGPTTNNLGTFAVQSSATAGNYRYAPLLNDSGNLAVVNLPGTNTLRLTMAGPQNGSTKQRTALNYLAFVPALLVESSSQAGGPFSIVQEASAEPGNRRVIVPAVGSTRFYRLRWDHPVTITGVSLAGEKVALTYQ